MTAVWPPSLPGDVIRSGYAEQPRMARRRFDSDTGPPIEAPKGTVRLTDIAVSVVMTTEQLSTFEDFVFTDIAQATLPFMFLHPRRQEQVRVKMPDDPPYQVAELTRGNWRVSFNLLVIG